MKVLSIGTDRLLFNKESSVALRTIEYGKKIGHLSIVVLSLSSTGNQIVQLSDEVTVYPTQSANRFLYIWDAIRLGKRIVVDQKFVRGDAIVTCQDPFECGFIGWRIGSYFRLPLHLQIHTDFLSPYFKTSFLQRLRVLCARFLLPKASGVRVVSDRIKRSIENSGIRLMHTPQVLPIRIDHQSGDATPSDQWKDFTFTIVMASRLTKEKRIGDALEALQIILKSYPHTGLIIAGDGPERESLIKKARELGVYDSVRFVGWRQDISSLMRSAQMFLSTSEFEGYGMSIVEAGMASIPVVSTHVGIAGDVLVHNVNSLLCPVGDILCIVSHIAELIAHNDKRHMLAAALNQQVVARIPSQEAYVDMYVSGLKASLQ